MFFVMCQLQLQMLPLTTNIKDAYKSGQDDEQNFIQNLALFLTTFLTQHGQLLERTVQPHFHILYNVIEWDFVYPYYCRVN